MVSSLSKTPVSIGPADSLIFRELKVLYPALNFFGSAYLETLNTDTALKARSHVVLAGFKGKISVAEFNKMQAWLRVRYQSSDLKLLVR